jgi:hypothetical protein
MGQTSATLAVGSTFTFRDKEYTVSPLTVELQAKFETWLERRLLDALRRQKVFMTDEEFKDAQNRLIGDIAIGKYSLGSPAYAEAAKTLHGIKELLYLSLSKTDRNVTRELVDAIIEEKMEEASEALKTANPPDPTQPETKAPASS